MSIEREKERLAEIIGELESECLDGVPDKFGCNFPISRERAEYLLKRVRKAVDMLFDEREHESGS